MNQLVNGKIYINKSLSPFVIIYNKNGTPVTENGYLNGSLPVIPIGVLQSSNKVNYHIVTWQLNSSKRFASITVATNEHYIVSARSISELEKRRAKILGLTLIPYLLSVIVILS